MKKQIFFSQHRLESDLKLKKAHLDGSKLMLEGKAGYYQLTPFIKITSCVSEPGDLSNLVGKCAAVSQFERRGIDLSENNLSYGGKIYAFEEGFLGDFFGDAGAAAGDSQENIEYDPALIETLNNDHTALISLFTEIVEASADDNFSEVSAKLYMFGNKLRLHLMTEQIKFHTYLEQALHESLFTQQLNATFQERIVVIGETAMAFLKEFEDCEWNDSNKKAFVEGWSGLGEILTERIALEEDLYKLYLPKSSYKSAV